MKSTNRSRQEEKKIQNIRSIVIGFCGVSFLIVIVAMMMFPSRKESVMVDEPEVTVGRVLPANSLVPGADYPTNSDDGSVLIVERGASFTMMPTSTNQPEMMSEQDFIALQERARNTARNAETLRAHGFQTNK